MSRINRFTLGIALLTLSIASGCGSSTTPVAESSAGGAASSNASTIDQSTADLSPAMDTVSQFLDALRRGGSDAEAMSLVTSRSREVIRETGLVMQPIGSPAAKFEVTRSEPYPGQDGAALVHSVWTEPSQEGTPETSEVVCVVQREPDGWKISGLVIGNAESGNPFMIDFENVTDMAYKLGPAPTSDQPTVLQATAPESNLPAETQAPVVR